MNNEIKWEDIQSNEPLNTEPQQPTQGGYFNWATTEATANETSPIDTNPNTFSSNQGTQYVKEDSTDWGPFTKSNSEHPNPEIHRPLITNKTYSKLGSVNKIQINTDLYTLDFNIKQILDQINTLTLTPLDEKGRYYIDFFKSEYLNEVISTLSEIASQYSSTIKDCFIYKIKRGDNLLNIYKGKPSNSFIYYLQADRNSSHVINDLSFMGGPSLSQTDPASGILNIFPGWVPYSLSVNNSKDEMIAIAGTFE